MRKRGVNFSASSGAVAVGRIKPASNKKMILFVEPNSNVLYIQYTANFPPNFASMVYAHIQGLIRSHGRFFICVDLKGLGISALVKQKEWIDQVVQTSSIENYYDNLVEIHIHNASLIAKQVMGMLKRVVRRDAVQKIKFVGKHDLDEA